MKKKLEAELISIAHRILKLKNKSDLVQLHQETQKLYEKLSVLRFVEENFSDVKPTIGHAEIEDKLAVIFDTETPVEEPVQDTETAGASQVSGHKDEAIKEIISGISENASKQEAEPASAEEEKTPEQSEIVEESVSELDAPEENVAPIEAEATEQAKEAEKPEDTPEAEPQKVEEPNQDKEPDPSLQGESAKQIKAEANAEDLFKPAFEWGFEAKAEEPKSEAHKITPAQISFDDLLGQDYVDPVFVKPEEIETRVPTKTLSDDERHAAELAESNRRLADLRGETYKSASETSDSKQNVIPISRNFNDTTNVISINKSENLNDRISKGITIGLNDRIAFMKHLFNNSSEDYNRVLSQLITFDTLAEAQSFIDTMVKPDYNNWEGKDEYEQRFMEIVEKKFS